MLFVVLITVFFGVIHGASRREAVNEVELGHSLMRHMWITPIQLYSLVDDISRSDDPTYKSLLDYSFIGKAKNEILSSYEEFLASDFDKDRDATVSDHFYLFQQDRELKRKICLHENEGSGETNATCNALKPPSTYLALSHIFHHSVVNYFRECYLDNTPAMQAIEAKMASPTFDPAQSMSIWSSVHGNGSYHASHHHKNSLLSGIFYVNAPPHSGAVVFEDPRGPLPPFGRSLHITPQAGELILFPSWLMHQVLPSMTIEPRISVSFNYNGDWESTTDINQGFYL